MAVNPNLKKYMHFRIQGSTGYDCSQLLLWTFLLCAAACKDFHRNRKHAGIPKASIEKGAVLAERYCRSCHLLPDPALLDADSWEQGVLPNMGPLLGIFRSGYINYPYGKNDPYLDSNFYPDKPVLTGAEWESILDYYTATSPDTMPGQQRPAVIRQGLPQFTVQPVAGSGTPATTLVRIDTAAGAQGLLLFNSRAGALYRLDRQFNRVDSLPLQGAVTDVAISGGNLLLCNIGRMNPNNGRWGKALWAQKKEAASYAIRPLLDSLARPVQVTAADLDADGKEDLLVCAFGFLQGNLSWYRQEGDGRYRQQVLRARPGALRTIVQDYNRDGLPDIWALFSQGEEGIFLYTNKGGGRFEERQVLRFPPVYGSTYFELTDCNGDGFEDIVYTCGDNADYSMVLKPYHGIYIFLNNGRQAFRQQYFYPVNGCYKALARDYDRDGDVDIAAISFFADYARQPEEGFVYLQNLGNFSFQPYSFAESTSGRWLTMDAGDLDGDGYIDLVVGNFAEGPPIPTPSADWKSGPGFIFLKNKGGNKTTGRAGPAPAALR